MTSYISLAIYSLASMCLWMGNVFTDSLINGMKEMEKRGGNLFFSKEKKKKLSFHKKEWLHSLGSIRVSRVWLILI